MRNIIFLFVLLIAFKTGFGSYFIDTSDSSSLKKRIKERATACKQLNKKRLVYRLNSDTLFYLGRNRDERIVGFVAVEDYRNNENKIFIYDSSGLFHVTVRKNFRRQKGKRQQVGFLYFENGNVVKQGGEVSIIDPARLLREAAFLRDYVGPLRTSLR